MSFYFEWDIYSYLFVAFASLFLVRNHPRAWITLGGVGAVLMLIPFWLGFPDGHGSILYSALIGDCREGGGGWPLLPWIGIPWLTFAIGRSYRHFPAVQRRIDRIGKKEASVWVILLALSIPFVGGYHDTPIGPNFSCFMFRKSLLVFWGNFVWFIALARLSLDTRINRSLSSKRVIRWVSRLEWSRNFGLCYILQLALLGLGSSKRLVPVYLEYPRLFDLFVLALLPTTEILARGLRQLTQHSNIKAKGAPNGIGSALSD